MYLLSLVYTLICVVCVLIGTMIKDLSFDNDYIEYILCCVVVYASYCYHCSCKCLWIIFLFSFLFAGTGKTSLAARIAVLGDFKMVKVSC